MPERKTLNEDLFYKVSSANLPRLHTCKNKTPFWDKSKPFTSQYPAQTIVDMDYADDIAVLANTPAQPETLLHCLGWADAGIGLYLNAHKMEYMCFNQRGDIATLNGRSRKLVDNFTYLGSSVSSTERDINMQLAKVWTAVDRLLVIWKSDLTDEIKHSFFQAAVVSIMLYGCTT